MLNQDMSHLWKVHVKELFEEILLNNTCTTLHRPLNILLAILKEVAERAIELDDLELNKQMLRLCLYSISDPKDPKYDPDLVTKILGMKTN